jgi:hypothetical protein
MGARLMMLIAASAGLGAVSGLLRAAAMAGASNVEQRLTHRPTATCPRTRSLTCSRI